MGLFFLLIVGTSLIIGAILKEKKNRIPKRPPEDPNLRWQRLQADMGKFIYEEEGIVYPFTDGTQKIKWTEIERIAGYKADLMTTDEIRMDIQWKGLSWTLTEETPGWYQLLKRLAVAFPSIPEGWDWDIVQPPFATNYTVLYEREDCVLPKSNNFYCSLRTKDPQSVIAIFRDFRWYVCKSGKAEWEFQTTWAELSLERNHDGLLLNGRVAFHPNNVNRLDQLLDKIGVYYQYEYYDEEKVLLHSRE